jgi:hypothetical protein
MSTFYAVSAGAAATLVGLLFVAVQLGGPAGGGPRRAMARSTFSVFVLLFALSLYSLVPSATLDVRSWVTLLAAAGGAFRAARTWLPVWRAGRDERGLARLWQIGWLLAGPLLAYGFLAGLAAAQLRSPSSTVLDDGAGGAFVVLFVIGLRNAWGLLVEVTAGPSVDR